MSDDKQLIERFGKEEHFRVPDGYFDTLAGQLMSKLPERSADVSSASVAGGTPALLWRRVRPWLAAAVVVGAIALGASRWQAANRQPIDTFADVSAQQDYYTLDEATDYAMLDNNEMYALMASE